MTKTYSNLKHDNLLVSVKFFLIFTIVRDRENPVQCLINLLFCITPHQDNNRHYIQFSKTMQGLGCINGSAIQVAGITWSERHAVPSKWITVEYIGGSVLNINKDIMQYFKVQVIIFMKT